MGWATSYDRARTPSDGRGASRDMPLLPRGTRRRIIVAGALLGVGLMGTLDGALFHEVLGWHQLLDQQTSDPRTNQIADGLFHLATWTSTVLGLAVLWHAASRLPEIRAGHTLLGSIIVGAATFNVAKVVIDHFVLGLHLLHPSGNIAWDIGFAIGNVALAALGYGVLRADDAPRVSRAHRRQRRPLGE